MVTVMLMVVAMMISETESGLGYVLRIVDRTQYPNVTGAAALLRDVGSPSSLPCQKAGSSHQPPPSQKRAQNFPDLGSAVHSGQRLAQLWLRAQAPLRILGGIQEQIAGCFELPCALVPEPPQIPAVHGEPSTLNFGPKR